MKTADVAILGAGPAGMAAAIAAREQGLSVVVLDEQLAPGGQIYRAVLDADPSQLRVLGDDYAAGAQLAQRFCASGAEHVRGASVWEVTRDRVIRFLVGGANDELRAGSVILANGAMERPVPVPGWTLPGVMTAGAAQILLKSADVVPAGAVVLAGCGPLLYLLAVQYVRAGATIAAIVDTSSRADEWRALPLLAGALRDWRLLDKGRKLLAELRRARVTVHRGATGIQIEGTDRARAIRFTAGGREQRIEASLVLLHQGVIPNTQVTRSLRAVHVWDEGQLCFRPQAGPLGELVGLDGFYVAGDACRIMGAVAAQESGRVAGLAVAGLRPSADRLQALCAARPFLDSLYRPKAETRVPPDAAIVCRCEEVTAGEIRGHVRDGCVGPNQLKAFTRCGMGPCQGQQCALTVCELIAQERRVSPAEVGLQRVRPPLRPITLGELAG